MVRSSHSGVVCPIQWLSTCLDPLLRATPAVSFTANKQGSEGMTMTEISEHTDQMRLVKSVHLDVDEFEGELILMNLESQQVVMLNAAGLALWHGLEKVPTRRAAIELVTEALPSVDPGETERGVDALINRLVEGGFLREVPETAAG
jgi:hypothetical protein